MRLLYIEMGDRYAHRDVVNDRKYENIRKAFEEDLSKQQYVKVLKRIRKWAQDQPFHIYHYYC
ncbi:hypothetical protein ES703_77446 [subsurface metagenome]